MIIPTSPLRRRPVVAVLLAAMLAGACGGTPAASGGTATGAPAAGASGGGAAAGGPLNGKRLCQIVTIEQATEILGEAPPRGEASDDRLSKSHTCAYKPGPRLILQIQVTEGITTAQQFDAAVERLTQKVPVEGIGEKAYFIPRTEPPAGTRLYILAKGMMVLVNIGREDVPEESLQTAARDLAPGLLDAL